MSGYHEIEFLSKKRRKDIDRQSLPLISKVESYFVHAGGEWRRFYKIYIYSVDNFVNKDYNKTLWDKGGNEYATD